MKKLAKLNQTLLWSMYQHGGVVLFTFVGSCRYTGQLTAGVQRTQQSADTTVSEMHNMLVGWGNKVRVWSLE